MKNASCIFSLLTACLCIVQVTSSLHRTPRPPHYSCTDDIIDSASCEFGTNSCGYGSSQATNGGGLYWRIYGPILARNTNSNYLNLVDPRQGSGTRGSSIKLVAAIHNQDVQAVCLEFKYRAIGYPRILVRNERVNGSSKQLAFVTGGVYPEWRTSRSHSCIHPDSYLTFTVTRGHSHLSVDLDSIRVTRSTMNCTEDAQLITTPPPPTTPTTTTTIPTTNSSTKGANGTCSAHPVAGLSCDFHKDLCGYTSVSNGTGDALEWKRDWFYHAGGISAKLADPSLNAPVGSSARLSRPLLLSTQSAICVHLSFWGSPNATLSLYNERPDGWRRLLGEFVATNATARNNVSLHNICVEENSSISIEGTKTSVTSPLWLWMDDLKVTTSTNNACTSPQPSTAAPSTLPSSSSSSSSSSSAAITTPSSSTNTTTTTSSP